MTALSILAFIFAAAAIIGGFMSYRWTAIAAMIATALAFAATSTLPKGSISTTTFVMWECCGLIVLGLGILLPPAVRKSRAGTGYLMGASLAGGLLGWAIAQQWLVLGVIIGTLLGALAYVTTPNGKHLGHFSTEFIQYLSAKGLPTAVIVAMSLISVVWGLAAMTPTI